MTKALELTVFAKEPGQYGREATYNSPDGLWAYPTSHADAYAQGKRLTDAELAADYWGLRATADGINWSTSTRTSLVGQVNVLLRFATLPHYDEATQ